jgi:hypothetical protein
MGGERLKMTPLPCCTRPHSLICVAVSVCLSPTTPTIPPAEEEDRKAKEEARRRERDERALRQKQAEEYKKRLAHLTATAPWPYATPRPPGTDLSLYRHDKYALPPPMFTC